VQEERGARWNVDVVMFSLKRAHHAAVRAMRWPAKCWGLTPARLDMMYALSTQPHGTPQSWLRQALGVSRTTVSRMLQALEELGLVRRRASDWDRRTRWVELTDEGRARIQGAIRDLVRSGAIELVVRTGVALDRFHDDVVCARQREALLSLLHRWRVALADFGFLYMGASPESNYENGWNIWVERPRREAKRYRKPRSRRRAA
jgi:DNA-binding MarR family transcriptional regulator